MKTVSKSASKLLPALALVVLAGVPHLAANSLWPSSGVVERGMYADRKAGRPGDILSVVVAESIITANTQSTKTARDSTVADSISTFLYPGLASHKGVMPAVSTTGKAAYDGSGDIQTTQSISGKVAVVVTDVLPNGNLVIQGVRKLTYSGQTVYIVLHGLVRQDDIASDNTIQSPNIADARIEFIAEGSLTDTQKRGWLSGLYEKLRPL